jgi:hypothetical protein
MVLTASEGVHSALGRSAHWIPNGGVEFALTLATRSTRTMRLQASTLPLCAFAGVVAIGLANSGCMSNPRIEDLSPQERAKLSSIAVLDGRPERSFNVVGTVTGLSCNRNKYQAPDVSDQEAREGLKLKAAQMDADAVINTFCQKSSDTDWRNNCWSSVKCVGDAVRFEK